MKKSFSSARLIVAFFLLVCYSASNAAILPEDRADLLFHQYDGGGVEISGPSVLVRKQVGSNTSLVGNYYVDMVTSASIDVLTTASPYTEERTERTIAVDYLNEKTTLSFAHTNSEESDFTANSYHIGISQEFFGDLTTISIGYSLGDDEVRQRGNPTFKEFADRQHYRLGVSQILTKNWIVSSNVESITDEGYLNNPYRQYRITNTSANGYEFRPEEYPNTRTSTAISIQSLYYLPHRAAVKGIYRYYNDDWDIKADTYEIAYVQPVDNGWEFDLRYRFYSQDRAHFYSDLFDGDFSQEFYARDKELSTFESQTIGFGVTYDLLENGWGFIDRGSLNFFFDHIMFDYDDFRDIRGTVDATNATQTGNEPFYSFDANVIRAYISIWY